MYSNYNWWENNSNASHLFSFRAIWLVETKDFDLSENSGKSLKTYGKALSAFLSLRVICRSLHSKFTHRQISQK